MLKNICKQLLLLQNQKLLLITCDWDSDAYGGESLVAAVHSHFSLGNQFLQNLQLKFCLYARTIRIFSWLDHQLFLRILPCTNKLFFCVCASKYLYTVHVGFHRLFYAFFAQVLCIRNYGRLSTVKMLFITISYCWNLMRMHTVC